ncbi:MAG: TlpA family protein disulfide reductase [Lachnospiraceae bacterium]|nr:TlpA family protein disulfide reductase [Lachnospiraceae bacterium]
MEKKKVVAIVSIAVLGIAFVALLVFILLHNQSVKNQPVAEGEESQVVDPQVVLQPEGEESNIESTSPEENPADGENYSGEVVPEADELEASVEEIDYAKVREDLGKKYGYGLAEGKVLPDDVILTDMEGKKHPVTEYLGKPLYINLFTTWCGPCNAEMPDLAATAKEYAEEMNFILVDLGDSKREIESFVKQHGLTIPMYYTDGTFGSEYIESIPRQVVLDCYGRVVSYKVGGMSRADMQILCGLAISASE